MKQIARISMYALICLLGIVPLTHSQVWDGKTVASQFSRGNGRESFPYEISTPGELAYLATLINHQCGYEGCYFRLTADIDLNGHPWIPIGNTAINPLLEFNGVFDGGNHLVKGLSVPETEYATLFGETATQAIICNLKVTAKDIHGSAQIATITAINKGRIINCNIV